MRTCEKCRMRCERAPCLNCKHPYPFGDCSDGFANEDKWDEARECVREWREHNDPDYVE